MQKQRLTRAKNHLFAVPGAIKLPAVTPYKFFRLLGLSAVLHISLVDRRGRKYLTAIERQRFIKVAGTDPTPIIQTFTLTLANTGCRISEALAARYCDVDLDNLSLRFKTLKRRKYMWREVAVPQDLI